MATFLGNVITALRGLSDNTWNNSAKIYDFYKVNISSTNALANGAPVFAAGSMVHRQQKNGVDVYTVDPNGNVVVAGIPKVLQSAIPAGGTAGLGILLSTTTNFGIFFGSGLPTLSAAKGSLYLRSDGSTTQSRGYINTDGGTTWTPITTVA